MNVEEIKKYIQDNDGIFMSVCDEIVGTYKRTYINFICKNGHQNKKRFENIYTECLICLRNKSKHNIEDCYKLAKQKNGKFLSEKYINNNTKNQWQCSNGHTFEGSYINIKRGGWCKYCLRYSLDDMKKLAQEKDGKCLSNEFKNVNKQKLLWECKYGHQWKTTGSQILIGQWCSICNESISEITCRRILEFIYNEPFLKRKPEWLITEKGNSRT